MLDVAEKGVLVPTPDLTPETIIKEKERVSQARLPRREFRVRRASSGFNDNNGHNGGMSISLGYEMATGVTRERAD